jgi:hypothetical protein
MAEEESVMADDYDERRFECPATREAVEELEEEGHMGCPLCGCPPDEHKPEA